MALLGKGPRAWSRLRLLSLLAALASAGACAWLGIGGADDGPVFSHRIHVVEEDLECVSCHEGAAVEDDPGWPGRETCESCHVVLDEERPEERRVAALFSEDGYRAKRASALDAELVFSHLRHVGAVESCESCHRGIERSERIDAGITLGMDDCTSCHADRGVPVACATCHTEIDESWGPPSHAELWAQRHGQVFRSGSSARIDQCSLCHTDSTCVKCHAEEPPQSHNNFFRLRGHGLAAQMDRASCATCHRADSCQRCHEEVLPVSHSGQWGGTRSTHCLVCHFPLPSNGCIACHKGTPSHAFAAPKPSWHTPAMNCRQCHGLTQPLPHVDGGTDCNLCHL